MKVSYWDRKAVSALLEENHNLYRLIEELYRQINFLSESLERYHQYQLKDIRDLITEAEAEMELNELSLEEWSSQYLVKRRDDRR